MTRYDIFFTQPGEVGNGGDKVPLEPELGQECQVETEEHN